MTGTIEIRVAEDFSRTPAGRYRSDGRWSGEAFREDHLGPALQADTPRVVVYLDGVEGYGSSFLEEAFGGLVRRANLTGQRLHRVLEIKTNDEAWKREIWDYIDQAAAR